MVRVVGTRRVYALSVWHICSNRFNVWKGVFLQTVGRVFFGLRLSLVVDCLHRLQLSSAVCVRSLEA